MPKKTMDILNEMNQRTKLLAMQGKEDLTEYRLETLLRHFKLCAFDYDIKKDTIYVCKEDMQLHDFTDYWFEDGGEFYYLENLSKRLDELVRMSMAAYSRIKLEEIRQNTSGETIFLETPLIYKPGNTRWVNIIAHTLLDENGKPAWVMGYCRDVQKEKKEMDRLQTIAQTDPLTGFKNRNAGMERMKEHISEEREIPHYIAVVDLDKFKDANDLFGHTFGDMILKDATECMRASLERGTIFCRTGGDEFLLFGQCKDSDDAMQKMLELKKKIAHQVMYQEACFNVSASIGVSIYPIHGTTLEELYDKADMAMYHAKKNGLSEPALYDDTMDAIEIGRK